MIFLMVMACSNSSDNATPVLVNEDTGTYMEPDGIYQGNAIVGVWNLTAPTDAAYVNSWETIRILDFQEDGTYAAVVDDHYEYGTYTLDAGDIYMQSEVSRPIYNRDGENIYGEQYNYNHDSEWQGIYNTNTDNNGEWRIELCRVVGLDRDFIGGCIPPVDRFGTMLAGWEVAINSTDYMNYNIEPGEATQYVYPYTGSWPLID